MEYTAKLLLINIAEVLCMANPFSAAAELHSSKKQQETITETKRESAPKPGSYQMVYHWNHLDWNFRDQR